MRATAFMAALVTLSGTAAAEDLNTEACQTAYGEMVRGSWTGGITGRRLRDGEKVEYGEYYAYRSEYRYAVTETGVERYIKSEGRTERLAGRETFDAEGWQGEAINSDGEVYVRFDSDLVSCAMTDGALVIEEALELTFDTGEVIELVGYNTFSANGFSRLSLLPGGDPIADWTRAYVANRKE